MICAKCRDSKFEINECENTIHLIRTLESKYRIDVLNFYPVCFCSKTLVFALRIVETKNSILDKVIIKEIPSVYKKIILYHNKKLKEFFEIKSFATPLIESNLRNTNYELIVKFNPDSKYINKDIDLIKAKTQRLVNYYTLYKTVGGKL